MQIATKPHLSIAEFDPDTAELDVTCPFCDSKRQLTVDFNSLHDWVTGGRLIQVAFPELSPSDREALVSGVCDTCWDKMGDE